jgi:hypothetical protein
MTDDCTDAFVKFIQEGQMFSMPSAPIGEKVHAKSVTDNFVYFGELAA